MKSLRSLFKLASTVLIGSGVLACTCAANDVDEVIVLGAGAAGSAAPVGPGALPERSRRPGPQQAGRNTQ